MKTRKEQNKKMKMKKKIPLVCHLFSLGGKKFSSEQSRELLVCVSER